jgi:predicted ATP-grasp superfamily ATP-dependent carboligase
VLTGSKIAILAFEGWNDAGESASGAVEHLIESWNASLIYEFDPELYYDFQVNRPIVRLDGVGIRSIHWRSTQIYRADDQHGKEIYLIKGIEPSMRWKSFASELISNLVNEGIDTVVALGALLSDTPHTRPVPITGVAIDIELADRLGLERATYEGPTGIIGVIQDAFSKTGVTSISLWAAIPHYVSQPPCPKGSMALLDKLEELLDIAVPLADLPERSAIWMEQVAELAANDEEITEYISKLEENREVSDLPMASGEAIAQEFERYLRRRDAN